MSMESVGYVYVLLSQKDGRTYTGSTDNLTRRLAQHNSGLVKSTKDRFPLKLVHSEELASLKEARKKEKYYKGASGRKKLKVFLKDVIE